MEADSRREKPEMVLFGMPFENGQINVSECKTCTHYSHKFAYCSGPRSDLPQAYGKNHPLHRLPADRGASCAVYRVNPAVKVGR